ncbi:MAG: hypothetical protein NC931_05335 [Candidatus Omnitrophica bacterium]|nr:hypothetical protein [Candidatus Omnitrophota bacterium]
MLKRGFLAKDSVYISYSHKEKQINEYLSVAREVFDIMKEAIEKGKIKEMLKGPVAQQGFKRLT